jgi:hypothetical protein
MIKKAFYPCCAGDIKEPLELLSGIVDEVYFCDIKDCTQGRFLQFKNSKPKPVFLHGDMQVQVEKMDVIDVLFYRKDSMGEGGSELLVLHKKILSQILSHFRSSGGRIITDGANSDPTIFSNGGLGRWRISLADNQPFLSYRLKVYDVVKKQESSSVSNVCIL